METQNNLQKNIGITLSVIVMLGVFFVTIFLGKQSVNTGATDQTLQIPPAIIPKTSPIVAPKKPTPVVNNNSDENDDENFGATPISQTPPPAPVTVQAPPATVPKKTVSVYKDGTYSATGSYMSPGGYDQLGVSITLKNDIVTGASVTNMAGDGRSRRYQDMFIASYKQYVIGKNIANLYLTKISGASLTPSGFNDALSQIKAQAKA